MTLTCSLLNHTQILEGDAVLSFPTERSRALFIYLAMHPDQEISREHLAGLFWPESTPIQARRSLRGALSRARQTIQDPQRVLPILHPSRKAISLRREGVWVDVHALTRLLDNWQAHRHPTGELCDACIQSLEEAAQLYAGPFLQDIFISQAQPFEEWVIFQREMLHNRVIAAQHALLEVYVGWSAWRRVIDVARRLLALAPWEEDIHIQLMQALALNGQRGAALQHYAVAGQMLREELDVEPGPKLRACYERIRQGAPTHVDPGRRAQGDVNPYRGLHPFQPEDANCFFGREAVVQRLLEMLHRQSAVILIGPSGSGKSSLIQAGVLPRLQAWDRTPAFTWQVVCFRPGARPFDALARALAPLLQEGASDPVDLTHLAEELAAGACTLQDLCRMHQEQSRPSGAAETFPASRLLLIMDQAEELFTLCTDPLVRNTFLDVILGAVQAQCAAPGMAVFAALRADFMGEALRHGALARVIQSSALLLGPMGQEELQSAIVEPARLQGVHFEAGLVERLLGDLGDPGGGLPFLEFTLTQLWEMRRENWIVHEAYEEIEHLSGALMHYADGVYARLTPEEQQIAQQLFLRLVVVGQGAEPARRLATRREIGEQAWPVVQKLAASRLIITDQSDHGQETAELVHEVLARGWPRLQNWIEEDRAFQVWRQRLGAMTTQWQETGRDVGALLRGAPLTEAERWLAARPNELSVSEHRFIALSVAENNRILVQQEARQQAAQRQARVALGRQLSAQAHLLAASKVDLALLLSLEALQRLDAPQDRRRLLTGLMVDPRLITFRHHLGAPIHYIHAGTAHQAMLLITERNELWCMDGEAGPLHQVGARPYLAVRSTPDGRRSALVDPHEVLVWDAQAGAVVQSLPRHQEAASRVCFSGDGRRLFMHEEPHTLLVWDVDAGLVLHKFLIPEEGTLAAVNQDGSRVALTVQAAVVLLDGKTGQPLCAPLAKHAGPIHDCAFSPDGAILATASFDGSVRLWDAATGAPRGAPLVDHQGRVLRAVFSPGGDLLATGGTDNRILLWSTATGKQVAPPLVGHSNWVRALAFLPDGRTLAGGDADGNLILWDIASPQMLTGHADRVMVVQISPDGTNLITASHDRRLGIWDAQTGKRLGSLATGHDHGLMRAAFSPDGHRLALGDAGGQVSLWDPTTWQVVAEPSPVHEAALVGMAFSPEGLLATGDFNGEVALLDSEDGAVLRRWQAFSDGWALGMAFHPIGDLLAVGSTTGAIGLWEVASGRQAPVHLSGHTNWVTDLLFTPDGKELISASSDHTLRVWDVKTGRPVGQPLTGHSAQVWNISFDHSRPQLVLVSLDSRGNVIWWNWEQREPLGPALHAGVETESMALTPDGRHLFLGSFDAIAQMWTVPTAPWRERAQAIANRGLTAQEQAYYLGG